MRTSPAINRGWCAGCAPYVFALLLAGCEPVATSGPVEYPQELYDYAFASAIADRVIAKGCPALRYDQGADRNARVRLEGEMRGLGISGAQLDNLARNPPRARIQRDLFAWMERSGAVVGDPASICAAGRREMARNSRIGSFLSG